MAVKEGRTGGKQRGAKMNDTEREKERERERETEVKKERNELNYSV